MTTVLPVTTLAEAVREAAVRWADRPFVVDGGRTIGYAQFDRDTDVVAARLHEAGYRRGDRIAVAAPNSAEWLTLWLAAAKLGVIVVTLSVRYRESEFTYMLGQSGARGLVCSARAGEHDFESFFTRLAPQLPGVRDYWFLGSASAGALFAPGEAAVPAVEVAPDDVSVILYTSGTTGVPKGAALTQGSILGAAGGQARHIGQDGDVIIGNMPLNHVGGLSCTVASTLLSGGTVVLVPAFSPGECLDLVERHRATIFAGVPTMWTLMLAHPGSDERDLSSVRIAVTGGSNLEPALARRLLARLPQAKLVNLYGLSEVSGTAVMSRLDDDVETVVRTLGVPVPGYEARVVDLDGHEASSGELQLRGPAVAAGYWQLPQESAATFGADGWLRTGDVVDVEPDGHLVFRSRLKEMYLQGGYNVYPVEVENVLGQHPEVVAAAGVGVPDEVLGEVGRYFVQRVPGSQVGADALRAWCAERLANYKVPRQVVFVEEFPLTPAGKIQKSALPRE